MIRESKRLDVVVDEQSDEPTLTIFARNPLISWIVLTVGFFVSLWCASLVIYGLIISNYSTVLIMAGLTLAALWLTWRIGWRPRSFQIKFSREFIQIGERRFAYSDIQSYGLSTHGGDIVDPISVGVPQNITIGSHIYIEINNRYLPVTVGLKDAQAKEALRLFGQLLDKCRPA